MMEPKQGHQDIIIHMVDVHLALWAKLRLLFGWYPAIHSGISTEHKPGETEVVKCTVFLQPPTWFPRRKRIGFEEIRRRDNE